MLCRIADAVRPLEKEMVHMPQLLINRTAAKDTADKGAIAGANPGVAASHEVVIFPDVEAVRLADPDHADDIVVEAFKPLKELLVSFTGSGGTLWVCPPYFNARSLDQNNLIGGATVVEILDQGATSLSY